MRKILSILFILFSNVCLAQDIKLDTNQILIGEQAILTINAIEKNIKIWPDIDSILSNGIEIIKKDKIDTLNNQISQKIYLTAWESGSYYINHSNNKLSKNIILNVKSLNLDSDSQLKDIKAPLKAPLVWGDILPYILIFILLILLAYFIKKYFLNKNKVQKKTPPKVIIPCHTEALKKLNQLEQKNLWQSGYIKEYYSSLSEIIREYIEKRFDFLALEITTEEIILNLENNSISSETINIVSKLLKRSDLAKYAKSQPDKEDNIESLLFAKNIIKQTIKNEEK